MDLYIDRDDFGRGLARVQGIVERRSTIPILANVLLNARADGLRITATDSEIAFVGDFTATVNEPGDCAVDAAHLFQIVRTLPEATVHLKLGPGNRLEIRSGRATFRLPSVDAQEFPPLPAFDSRGVARINEGELRRLVEQTQFAVETNDSRYGLNGAHIEERKTESGAVLRMVSTDGHRLSAAEASFEGDIAVAPRMLVPRKALANIRKLLEGVDEKVDVEFGENAIRITRPGQLFWFRMLDGEFPDYRAVVPSGGKHRAQIRADQLARTLKRVSVLVHDRSRAVRFTFADEQLEISVQNAERGDVIESIPIELEGEAITVGFNVRYLQDILGVMTGEVVQLELAHPLAPCLVTDPSDASAFFVVMPMRLD